MDKTIYDLAVACGAEIDGGELPDYQYGYPGTPPTITFTDRQLELFASKIADKSWVYRPLTASDLRDM